MFTFFNLQTITIYLSFYLYILWNSSSNSLSVVAYSLFRKSQCECVHVFVSLYRSRSQVSPIHAQHTLSVPFTPVHKNPKRFALSLFAETHLAGESSDRERTIATLQQHGDSLLAECLCVFVQLCFCVCILLLLFSFSEYNLRGAEEEEEEVVRVFLHTVVVVVLVGSHITTQTFFFFRSPCLK